MNYDADLIRRIRNDLPPEALRPRPRHALFAIPLLALIVTGNLYLLFADWRIWAALPVAVGLGMLYGSLTFLGHEVSHGAAVKSRLLQNLILYPAFAPFLMSPYGWRMWHDDVHHRHPNEPAWDPDTFGSADRFKTRGSFARELYLFSPGSGHWRSALYLPFFFTLHVHNVFWRHSRRVSGFDALNRRRIAADTVIFAAFWLGMLYLGGIERFFFVLFIPMAAANVTVMSYIATNHLLRPLSTGRNSLATSMSITAPSWIDHFHFHFSHHVEHHLFPSMCSRYYPLVRRWLITHVKEQYVAPTHWRALQLLYRTPRAYADSRTLMNPDNLKRFKLGRLRALLKS